MVSRLNKELECLNETHLQIPKTSPPTGSHECCALHKPFKRPIERDLATIVIDRVSTALVDHYSDDLIPR